MTANCDRGFRHNSLNAATYGLLAAQIEYRSTATDRAVVAIARRFDGSLSAFSIFAAKSSSSSATRWPVSSSSMISSGPVHYVAMTGIPHAIASTATIPNPSSADGRSSRAAF